MIFYEDPPSRSPLFGRPFFSFLRTHLAVKLQHWKNFSEKFFPASSKIGAEFYFFILKKKKKSKKKKK
jgi:hypothetical protein